MGGVLQTSTQKTNVGDEGGYPQGGGSEPVGRPVEEKKYGAGLLDKYVLGKTIGQGAFGIVYSCQLKSSQEEFAVKMIDPVETPLADITREVEMLRLLSHPCVVGMKDVFYEKVFVCLVMTIYKGGDMIEGMQLHWQAKGQIPIPVIQNVSKMMVKGVEWIHHNSIIHRDLKGDNFLMSVKQMQDPQCRVYMSDFGTVVALDPGERLKQQCGTKIYWAPELYKGDYSFPVDMWAIGVIMYGMVTGRFPFKTKQQDVNTKEARMPSRATKDGASFMVHCLKKPEEERMNAQEAMEHRFLASIKSAEEITDEMKGQEEEVLELDASFAERGANAGVKQRRKDLVNQWEDVQNPGNKALMTIANDFEVENKHDDKTIRFEWWNAEKVTTAGFINETDQSTVKHSTTVAQDKGEGLLEADVAKNLSNHGISCEGFGQGEAKSLAEFTSELCGGQTRLMLDATRHKNLVRVVDVVMLRIVHGTGVNKRYLIKLSEKFPDGRVRDRMNVMPGTKKRPHENGRQVVQRIMKERLQITSSEVQFNYVDKEYLEEDEESPSYPGVRTVYRKEIFEGQVLNDSPEVMAKMGIGADIAQSQYVVQGFDGYLRTYFWASESVCVAKHITFKAPKEGYEISPLVPTPIGYNEEELQAFLESSGVGLDTFPESGPGSLAKLAEELQMGDAALKAMPDGRILRVVDVIILKVMRKNGDTLVQAGAQAGVGSKKGKQIQGSRLPGTKRRQDENLFWACHRIMNRIMKINENTVVLEPAGVSLIEEEKPSENYTNLPTLYRRRIIPATLVED